MDHTTLCAVPSNGWQRTKDEGQVTRDAFNPRPRTEGDRLSMTVMENIVRFNPRPRTEGDAKTDQLSFSSGSFNPRPRTEGDIYFGKYRITK